MRGQAGACGHLAPGRPRQSRGKHLPTATRSAGSGPRSPQTTPGDAGSRRYRFLVLPLSLLPNLPLLHLFSTRSSCFRGLRCGSLLPGREPARGAHAADSCTLERVGRALPASAVLAAAQQCPRVVSPAVTWPLPPGPVPAGRVPPPSCPPASVRRDGHFWPHQAWRGLVTAPCLCAWRLQQVADPCAASTGDSRGQSAPREGGTVALSLLFLSFWPDLPTSGQSDLPLLRRSRGGSTRRPRGGRPGGGRQQQQTPRPGLWQPPRPPALTSQSAVRRPGPCSTGPSRPDRG